jgi:hypothetical protein
LCDRNCVSYKWSLTCVADLDISKLSSGLALAICLGPARGIYRKRPFAMAVNVLSMLSNVPMSGMLSRKHDVYDALDNVPVECTCGSLVHGMDNMPMFVTYDMVSCVTTILRVGIRQQSLSITKKRLDSLNKRRLLRDHDLLLIGDRLASGAHRWILNPTKLVENASYNSILCPSCSHSSHQGGGPTAPRYLLLHTR